MTASPPWGPALRACWLRAGAGVARWWAISWPISELARRETPLPPGQWLAIMPGSKPAKLRVGMPFMLEVADQLARRCPSLRFLLPLAPTVAVADLLSQAGPANPIARSYGAGEPLLLASAVLQADGLALVTSAGTRIELVQESPAHGPLSQCAMALTTVGANTAELGALAVPMLVLVPTQHLEVMQAWDGLLGLLGRMPLLRRGFGVALTAWRLRHRGWLAFPNIAAGRQVVPERVGKVSPAQIAAELQQWLADPQRLAATAQELRQLRGPPGAVAALADLVCQLLPHDQRPPAPPS
jgi:lipid A disaccharide synthetase